jgi:hypothetical protein
MMVLLLFLNLYLFLIKADQSIIESDFHNNLPAEFNNPAILLTDKKMTSLERFPSGLCLGKGCLSQRGERFCPLGAL